MMFPRLHSELGGLAEGRLQAAVDLAVEAGNSTLQYFQTDAFRVERKSDRSPVTVADKNAEQLIRMALSKSFPDDAILGEEFGAEEGQSEYRWIIDPIDGTKSFISGVPIYSTLVGVTRNGEPFIGVILIPALQEIVVAAIGFGAWYSKQGCEWTAAKVSAQGNLGEGLFVTTQVDSFTNRGARRAFDELEKEAYVSRTWGDGYGYLLVATGRAEVMVDPICNPWDVAAVLPVIQEAGGRYSDWKGQPSITTGDGVGSNGLVHDRVLAILNS
jgi:histidinol phosphatase-like enzyme (inositol monophosphatase family)